MTEKNPFDMTEKAFQKYLDNFKQKRSKTDLEIARKGENVSGVRFKDNTQVETTGISGPKWAETPIAKKFYKEYSERSENKKAHGGYVKKYAKGGGVRKVRT